MSQPVDGAAVDVRVTIRIYVITISKDSAAIITISKDTAAIRPIECGGDGCGGCVGSGGCAGSG